MYPTFNGTESIVSFGYQPYYLGIVADFIPSNRNDYFLYSNYDYYHNSVILVII